MAPITHKIQDITVKTHPWAIEFRITRMWTNKNGYIEFIALDEKGDQIECVVPRVLADRYKDILNEGSFYKLSNFTVKENDGLYKTTSHEGRIMFLYLTNLRETIPLNIPRYKFHFTSAEQILSGNVDKTSLIDFIGLLVDVDTIYKYKSPRVNMTLRDVEGSMIRVILWGDWVRPIETLAMGREKKHNIIILYRAKINTFEGTTSVQSCWSTTDVLINYNCDEGKEFLSRLENEIAENGNNIVINLNYKVRELKDIFLKEGLMRRIEYLKGYEKEVGQYLIKAKVIKIETSGKHVWFYNTCKTHYTSIQQLEIPRAEDDGTDVQSNIQFCHYCPTCQSTVNEITSRFKVQILVGDGTGRISLVLFEKDVFKLIRKTCMQLKNGIPKEYDITTVPEELYDIVGNTYIFKVEVKDYNLQYENTTMAVKGVTNDDTLLKEFENIMRQNKNKEISEAESLECVSSKAKGKRSLSYPDDQDHGFDVGESSSV